MAQILSLDRVNDLLVKIMKVQFQKATQTMLVDHHRCGDIFILHVKDRFRSLTPAVRADLMVNVVFLDEPNQHVFELQIYHRYMLLLDKASATFDLD